MSSASCLWVIVALESRGTSTAPRLGRFNFLAPSLRCCCPTCAACWPSCSCFLVLSGTPRPGYGPKQVSFSAEGGAMRLSGDFLGVRTSRRGQALAPRGLRRATGLGAGPYWLTQKRCLYQERGGRVDSEGGFHAAHWGMASRRTYQSSPRLFQSIPRGSRAFGSDLHLCKWLFHAIAPTHQLSSLEVN